MPKSKVVLPDTNTIIRYLLKDVPDQFAQASDFFERVRSGMEKTVILESVLVECVYILTKFYKVHKKEAALVLTGLLSYKGVVNRDKTILANALNIFAAENLDMVDCVLAAKASGIGARLFTFDKALRKRFDATGVEP